MANYALDNAWERARRRLALLEQHLDPMTYQRLTALGVSQGWRCLEVGGGGGSVVRWLCRHVGATGHVTATDLDTRFLQEIDEPCLEVRCHDITAEALPHAQYDLVHARWLLHHLPHPEHVIARLVAALRPGGWLLLEEPDFFPVYTSTSQLYIDFMVRLTGTIVAASGRDCFWARVLPALVAGQGLAEVGGAGDIALLHGGSPMAELWQLTGVQTRDQVLASGMLKVEHFDAVIALLQDPTFWAFAEASIAVWGRRPKDGKDIQPASESD
jgi:protein-L-isoaspartate O-methyltransferase